MKRGISVNKSVKTRELYTCEVPYLKALFDSSEYPWEILPKIKGHIARLLETGIDGFTEYAPGVLIGKDVKIANRRPDTTTIFGKVTVTEGKKHQVRRMLMYAGCRIVYLKRISMGGLALDDSLAPGEYRALTADELASILNY